MNDGPSIWVRLRLRVVLYIIDHFKARAITLHQDARNEKDPIKSRSLRLNADDSDDDAEDLKAQLDNRKRT